MRFVALSILVLAAVVAVVGWRVTDKHHASSNCPAGNAGTLCRALSDSK